MFHLVENFFILFFIYLFIYLFYFILFYFLRIPHYIVVH